MTWNVNCSCRMFCVTWNVNCSCRVFCVTWNVNGRVPPFSLDPLLREYGVKGETDPLHLTSLLLGK